MSDGRTKLAADVEREVRAHFGSLVFDAVVPRSVRIAEAPSHGLPITTYDRRSAGAEAYWKVAMELVERS
jgi:chromosome partitioning protein